jgi:hypothetical protein
MRIRTPSTIESAVPATWALSEQCATPMAVIDRELHLRALSPALIEWLGGGANARRGDALALLDATPPSLCDAAARAFAQERRVWLREARLRCVIGDRVADLAFTPLGLDSLLLEVMPATETVAGTRLSESLRGFAHEVRGPLAGMRTSVNSNAGGESASATNAASASANSRAPKPASRSAAASTRRTARSSSTIQASGVAFMRALHRPRPAAAG